MSRLLNVSTAAAMAGAVLSAALGWAAVGPAHATQASFTINGTVTSPNPTLGYVSGAPVSFTWVLDDTAVRLARFSGPSACCAGGLGWYQDLFSTTPQLWRSITGSGLGGAWLPPVDQDDGSITLTVGNYPLPYPGAFQMLANAQLGAATGLQVNGRPVSALQMSAVYEGFDVVARVGAGSVFNTTPPDPTALLLAMVGTYAVDRTFSDFGSIWAGGPGGGQFTFRIDTLTIAAVPEPGAWALWLAGGLAVGVVLRRRLHGGTGRLAAPGRAPVRWSGFLPQRR